MGTQAQKAGASNYIGLAVICVGLVLYRAGVWLQEQFMRLFFPSEDKLLAVNTSS